MNPDPCISCRYAITHAPEQKRIAQALISTPWECQTFLELDMPRVSVAGDA